MNIHDITLIGLGAVAFLLVLGWQFGLFNKED